MRVLIRAAMGIFQIAPTKTAKRPSRDENLFLAKLAEETERWEGR